MIDSLVFSIYPHSKFGETIAVYRVTPVDEKLKIIDTINDSKLFPDEPAVKKILDKLAEISDKNLFKLFGKNSKSFQEFITKADEVLISKQIRPFMERRLGECISVIGRNEFPLYRRSSRSLLLFPNDKVEIFPLPVEVQFNFERIETGIRYNITAQVNDKKIQFNQPDSFILCDKPCIAIVDHQLLSFEKIDSKKLLPFFIHPFLSIAKNYEDQYFRKFVLNCLYEFKVNATGFSVVENDTEGLCVLNLTSDLKGDPVIQVQFQYGIQFINPASGQQVMVELTTPEGEYNFNRIHRKLVWEKQKMEQLIEFGLVSRDQIHFYLDDSISLLPQDRLFDLVNWLNLNSTTLNESNFVINQTFYNNKFYLSSLSIENQVTEEADWFDINCWLKLGAYEIPISRLKKYILNNIREYKMPNGDIVVLPLELFARFKDLMSEYVGDDEIIRLSINKRQIVDDQINEINQNIFSGIKRFNEQKLQVFSPPLGLNAQLRSYQQQGFSWLMHLQTAGLGGCLADDMGLGKTLQTISVLLESANRFNEIDAHIKISGKHKEPSLFDSSQKMKKSGSALHQSMVVMPLSLIHNWENEIRKFAPGLKILKHIGDKRATQPVAFNGYHIILTTYGTVRSDYLWMKNIIFFYLILDESQFVKNPLSKAYKALMELQSRHKLVLTGTPIENSLGDLWAQMNFVNPGLLGNLSFFRKVYITPIQDMHNKFKKEELRKITSSLILRRTKHEVEPDLPPYAEQTLFCPFDEEQEQLYQSEKSKMRNAIWESMEERGVEKSAILVLESLLRLRQIANHPRLFNRELDMGSGKFEEIKRTLSELIEEQHKVLVFSAFVEHLKLVQEYLVESNISFALLTGETRNREAEIKKFQNHEDNRVFLISLKAGGVGLNLTAADYVLLLDPWWNPASENQAISRAHRIGQDKKVMVYRFITEDTIEEKIQKLQQKKKLLADSIIENEQVAKILTKENVQELFE